MKVWKEGGVNQIMVGSILGYMRRAKVSFCLVLVCLGSPFYSELVSIFVAGVIHLYILQKRWGKQFDFYKMWSPDRPWEFLQGSRDTQTMSPLILAEPMCQSATGMCHIHQSISFDHVMFNSSPRKVEQT